jgi:parvulin-like peptidyl-prolyl isomerase
MADHAEPEDPLGAADSTNAVQALRPGEIAVRPVHVIYGWHVIKLLEARPAATPPFAHIKAQLAANLQQARCKQFLESALANAKANTGS